MGLLNAVGPSAGMTVGVKLQLQLGQCQVNLTQAPLFWFFGQICRDVTPL